MLYLFNRDKASNEPSLDTSVDDTNVSQNNIDTSIWDLITGKLKNIKRVKTTILAIFLVSEYFYR